MTRDNARDALPEVVERLRRGLGPRAIYLFGSYAYGKPHQDSDIDLLVVVERLEEPSYDVEARAYALLSGLAVPVEIQVVSRAEFEERRHWASSIERDVHERGVQLYAAA